jgi:putative DNA primase/helicase
MQSAKDQLVIRHAKAVQEGRDEDAAEAKRRLEELERKSRTRVADKRLTDQTEEGVADYFAMMFVNDVRFVPKLGWFRWKGSHWEQDEAGEVYGCFREVTARLRKQGLDMPTKTEEQEREAKAFRQFVVRVRSARSHDAVLRIASRDSRLVVKRDELDQRPTLLPCLNGTVDLTTGELCPAKREDLLSRVVPVEYDPKATAPMFEAFLRRIQSDREMRDFLQRLLGYGLFGFVREHVFPIFYGDGANGKSVLAQAVQHVVGEYAQTVPRTLVVETRNEQHKTQIARLHRTRMGFIHETERDARLNVEAVKMLTGGDVLTGHFMRKDFFDFMPSHTLYLLSNWKPQVDAAMRAVWRRLLLIPFDVEIPLEEQDLSLADKIVEKESAGVLRWLVEGAAWWWTFSQLRDGGSGLLPPKRVVDETKEYQLQEDVVGRFVDECCDLGKGRKVQAGKLYAAYKDYCKREGIEKPATSNKFADAIQRVKGADGRRIGKSEKSGGDGRRYYDGIGLHASAEQDPREAPDDDPENWSL